MPLTGTRLRLRLIIACILSLASSCSGESMHDEDYRELLDRGKSEFFAGDYDRALEIWGSAPSAFPYTLVIDKWRARAYLMKDQPSAARSLLSPYLQLAPEYPELLMLLGRCELELGNPEKALVLLSEAAKFLQGGVGIYLTQADAFFRFGLYQRAENARSKARLLLNIDEIADRTNGTLTEKPPEEQSPPVQEYSTDE
ncbi:MAG: tetratricopeptide repeat protein [Sediminispirochaetaceae bacterium]